MKAERRKTLQFYVLITYLHVPVVSKSRRLWSVVSAIFLRASAVRKAWCPLKLWVILTCHEKNIDRDSRHENIIESKKSSKAIVCNYLGTRIREKVIGLPFVDIETNSGNMTAFQGTCVFGSEMCKMNWRSLTYRIKAWVSIRPPLDVFINTTPFFVWDSVLSLIM